MVDCLVRPVKGETDGEEEGVRTSTDIIPQNFEDNAHFL